jgi:hypothetical protein
MTIAFNSFEAFAEHLAKVVFAEHEAKLMAMDKATKIVQKEAKAEIGVYQDAIGDIPGWAELADSTKADRVRLGYSENDPGLRSGATRDSVQRTVKEGDVLGEVAGFVGSDMDEMVWFELGTSKQPPRSVLAGSAMRKEDDLHKLIGEAVYTALIGKQVHEGILNLDSDD